MGIFKAAIIDDGVCQEMFDSSENLLIKDDLEVAADNFEEQYCSHGTDCIALIKHFTDISDIDWMNIAVLDEETDNGSVGRLLKGLEICEKEDVKLIHMSLGSVEFADLPAIKEAVDRLTAKGTVIVAALSNAERKTYPACISGVIGVKRCEPGSRTEHIYVDEPFDGINFLIGSEHEITAFDVKFVTQKSNSMAAPVITAKVIDILRKDNTLNAEEVIKILKDTASEVRKDDMSSTFMGVTEEEVEMPVIGWYMNDKETALDLAEKISGYFIADGYNSEVCSDSYSGYRKLPEKDIPGYFAAVRKFCMCDILNAVFQDKDMIGKFSSFDIIVTDRIQDIGNISSEIIDCSGMGAAEIFAEIMSRFDE